MTQAGFHTKIIFNIKLANSSNFRRENYVHSHSGKLHWDMWFQHVQECHTCGILGSLMVLYICTCYGQIDSNSNILQMTYFSCFQKNVNPFLTLSITMDVCPFFPAIVLQWIHPRFPNPHCRIFSCPPSNDSDYHFQFVSGFRTAWIFFPL